MVSYSDVKLAAKTHFKRGVIVNEPLELDDEFSLDGIDPMDFEEVKEYKALDAPLSRRPTMRTLMMLAECVFGLALLLPSFVLMWFVDYEKYDIVKFKYGVPEFRPNEFQEFFRWSVFLCCSFQAYIVAGWAVGLVSPLIVGGSGLFSLNLSAEARYSLKVVKRSQGYIAIFVWACLEILLGNLFLYVPSILDVGDDQAFVQKFLNRESTEKLLMVAAVIAAMFALEKYFIQLLTFHFHKESLATRISKNNELREIVGCLYRAARIGRIEAPRLSGEFADVGLHQLVFDRVLRDQESDKIASVIFKGLKQPDREFLRCDDFNAYLNRDDAIRAFKALDPAMNTTITLPGLKETIREIYLERDRLMEAIIENGRVIRRFDNVMTGLVAVLAGVGVLSLFHTKGYMLVVAIFSVYLAIAFLVKDTITRFLDAFRLIYVQRPYDVGDVVKLENVAYTVVQIKLFTTIFVRNIDKVQVYMPNHVLANKVIVNLKRLPLTVDKAKVIVYGNIPMAKVGSFRADLKKHTEDTFPEYSGACNFKIAEKEGNEVEIAIELTFQPSTDEKVLERRNRFKDKVKELLGTYDLTNMDPVF